MGAFLSIPVLGVVPGILGTVISSLVAGLTFFCTSKAATAFCKSCNCNSSVATRVGFSIIFVLNSIIAWIMLTPFAIKQIEKWSYEWVKMSCEEGKCYGVLAVHRICFALSTFHFILSLLLIGVHSTQTKRAEIQNGWWGPKVLAWLVLIAISFVIPNEFFLFWGNYIALIGSTIFILIGLVLLVDFAHSWSEKCLQNWQETDSNFWKWVLIGSTLICYIFFITLTVIDYIYFTPSGCNLNIFFITFNLILSLLLSVLSILPTIQSHNHKSGLSQSGMVVAYNTYLTTSAIANHDSDKCNPLNSSASTARTSMVVVGAVFTFLAIAYSTSRAATQSKALAGKRRVEEGGYGRLDGHEELGDVGARETRRKALMAAVAAGAIPASALDEEDDEDDLEDLRAGEDNDDEKIGTRYNYSFFHIIFAMGAMYVAMLLTNWNVITSTTSPHSDPSSGEDDYKQPMKIGRSEVAMWMRIVSSWICVVIYGWSLVAPVIWPERFEYEGY